MRSLRDRLKAISNSQPKAEPKPSRPDAYFMRETIVPLERLKGIECTTLEDIRACDPSFDAKQWNVRRVLFLDTETTGLSGGAGTLAFEIGLGFLDERGMVIRQYVMRGYEEEAAMLDSIASMLKNFDTLVTFNGKSFDIPLLESRMIMHRLGAPLAGKAHFDLLHACRRVYKLRLGRCNLSALEEAVLGDTRTDDLPGAQIPQRYFEFLKTQEFALLEDVLRHNLQDVESLASLTGHLCAVFRAPETLQHPEDMLGVGKTLLRTAHTQEGRRCLKLLATSRVSAHANRYLSLSYKRRREWTQSVAVWQAMISRGEGGLWPYVELAKYYEHIARDVPRALRYTHAALSYALNVSLLGTADAALIDALHKRIARLNRKQAQQRLTPQTGGNGR